MRIYFIWECKAPYWGVIVHAALHVLLDTVSMESTNAFLQGGAYAPENVAMYRRSLAAIDAHAQSTQASQWDQLEATQAALSKEVQII